MPLSLSKVWAKAKLVAGSRKENEGNGRKPMCREGHEGLDKSFGIRLPRDKMENIIVGLWKEVWLGLYEIDLEESRFHANRLQALYCGAGLALVPNGYIRIFDVHLYRHFTPRWNNGMVSLKLCDGMSDTTLYAIYDVLVAYKKEIPNLQRLYKLLERKQLDFSGGVLDRRSPFETDYLTHEFNKIALPMGKTLGSIDTCTDIVNDNIREELKDLKDKNGKLRKGTYIYEMVFPERKEGEVSRSSWCP